MAEAIILGLLGPLIEVGKLVAKPIQRQCNYLFCLKKNHQALKDEARELENAREQLQDKVDHAQNNRQRVFNQVVDWFKEADNFKAGQENIEGEIRNAPSGCLGIKSRYVLSRRAIKMADKIKEHHGITFGDSIAHHPRAPAHVSSTKATEEADIMELQSRNGIEEEIMTSLREKTATRLGIWGMAGLGKTTMAESLKQKVEKERLFDKVLMVAVGQDSKVVKIQQDIADWLDLKLEAETQKVRAQKLHDRLSVKESILIVLDDVWNEVQVNLKDIGIPREGVTILLTSRDVNMLKRVNAKEFKMEFLGDEEALRLFIEKAQINSDDENLVPIAEKFVQVCQGLPLTLVIIGSLLKDETNTAIWNDMLRQLCSFNVENIQNFKENVYRSVKLSFDKLNSVDEKKLFLLCSQFPEDSNMNLNDLALYCMSLRLFEHTTSNVEETRDRVHSVIKILKSRSLLLDGSWENSVKMHDLVRDVAAVIAKKEQSDDESRSHSIKNCKWISLQTLNEHPCHLFGVGLLVFNLVDPSIIEGLLSQNEMAGLNSLVLDSILFQSLPLSTRHLMNLRMLHFDNCDMECISIIGELLGLEILRCLNCDKIEELPLEIKKLKHLKLLEFEDCSSLERVVPQVISNLVELEELTIWGCFKGWESINATGEGRRNVSLKELESLKKLRALRIEIADVGLVEENVQLDTSSLAKYEIKVGSYSRMEFIHEKSIYLYGMPQGVKLGNWIYQLMLTTEKIVYRGAEELHELLPFKNLKELILESLPKLTNLSKLPNQNASLNNLCKVEIFRCSKLKNLFVFERAEKVFFRLESLWINQCDMMEELFYNDENDDRASNCCVTFPQLKILRLELLPSLVTFAKGVESINFPLLTELKIVDCPKFTRFPIGGDPNSTSQDNDYLFTLFNNQEVTFDCLKKLEIGGYIFDSIWCAQISHGSFAQLEELLIKNCKSIRSLFSYSVAANFISLKRLEIRDCEKMVNVISDGSIGEISSALKNVEEVSLINLPRLKHLWNHSNQWNSLTSLIIESCKSLVHVFSNDENGKNGRPTHMTFSKLKTLKLSCLSNLVTFHDGVESIGFPLLEKLKISECSNLIGIVSSVGCNKNSETDEDGQEPFHLICHQKVTFDCLKKLEIEGYAFDSIWCAQISHGSFAQLEELLINNCNSIRSLFSYSVAANFISLKRLKIRDCEKVVNVISDGSIGEVSSALKNVEEVSLINLPRLKHLWNHPDQWNSLHSLVIHSCKSLVHVFSNNENGKNGRPTHMTFSKLKTLKLSCLSNLVTFHDGVESIGFPLLEKLEISECSNLIGIVSSVGCNQNSETDEGGQEPFHLICHQKVFQKNKVSSHLTFSKLNKLVLRDVTNLAALCDGVKSVNFPVLETMLINDCPNFVSIISSIGCDQNRDDGRGNDTWHLFCCTKIKFDTLEDLTIIRYQNGNIWCHRILPCFFKQLRSLWINYCNEIQILFSFSIVENLENLKSLRIIGCNKMEKVIGDEDRVCDKHILFPCLTELELYSLPLLGKFCEWNSAFELPLLETIVIDNCPQMEYFSSAPLSTPKLTEGIQLNEKYVSERELNELGGLNGIIRHHASKPIMEPSSSGN